MKLSKLLVVFALLGVFTLSSCSTRLVDFTVISSKNIGMDIDKTNGKQVDESKGYVLGIGWNIKDAMDKALESAGPSYDLLVDGVVRYTSYPFYLSISVEGTAINSRKMRSSMGDAGFEKWLEGKDTYSKDTGVAEN